MAKTIRLIGPSQKAYAKLQIDDATPDLVCKIGKETRTDAQNRLMWPLLEDLRRQAPEHAQYSTEQAKLRFLDALGSETVHLPKIGNAGFFPVGQRSSTLTKEQFSLLIELILLEGDRCEVEWSRKSLDTRDEVLGKPQDRAA